MAEETEQYFARLRGMRQSRQMTLEEVYEKTRINLRYLEAIERGDLQFLSAPYVRAFLKAYAAAIGASVPEVTEQFDRLTSKVPEPAMAGETGELQSVVESDAVEAPPVSMHLPTFHISRSGLVLGALVIFIVSAYALGSMFESSSGTFTVSEQKPQPAAPQLVRQLTPQESGGMHAANTLTPATGALQLTGRAVENVWLSVQIDQMQPAEYNLRTNETIRLQANTQFVMRIGRSQAIELALNGRPLGELGGERTLVWNLVITKDGITQKELRLRTDVDGEIAAGARKDSTR